MSVKDNVLHLLKENRKEYLSGEEIAKKLNVSRNSIWKAVKNLTEDGYNIKGINNKGYCLESDNDAITVEDIMKYVEPEIRQKISIDVYKTIDSTNTVLKKMASEGEKEWKVLVAEEQTAGRGRMNRKFYSPSKTGIYMSFLLRPDVKASEALFITTMSAVAVSEAIEKVTGVTTGIKWVNDIYINGKKVCGILTEASIDVETGKMYYAIPGIGINVFKPQQDFPKEIKNIATSVIQSTTEYDMRSHIVAEVINNVYKYYYSLPGHEFMSKYRERSLLIGKNVYIVGDNQNRKYKVLDVDDSAALVVEDQNKEITKLTSGEVSVRAI